MKPPTKRDRIIEALRAGDKSTTELAALVGMKTANVYTALVMMETRDLCHITHHGSGKGNPTVWRFGLAPERLANAHHPKKVARA